MPPAILLEPLAHKVQTGQRGCCFILDQHGSQLGVFFKNDFSPKFSLCWVLWSLHWPLLQVSPQDINAAFERYESNLAFQALPLREREIVAFLDVVLPVKDGDLESTVDLQPGQRILFKKGPSESLLVRTHIMWPFFLEHLGDRIFFGTAGYP